MSQPGAHKKPDSTGFKEILTQTLETESAHRISAPKVPGLSGSRGISVQPLGPMDNANMLNRIEYMIDLMDQYRSKMEDPKASLKDLAPLVQTLQAEQEKMEFSLEQLEKNDTLGGILKQALVTASLEVAKFNSGRYNNE
jgi:hypothetical protein